MSEALARLHPHGYTLRRDRERREEEQREIWRREELGLSQTVEAQAAEVADNRARQSYAGDWSKHTTRALDARIVARGGRSFFKTYHGQGR